MVSICPLISKFSSPCTNPFVSVPSALITIGISVIFLFHSFFSSQARSRYLSLFLLVVSRNEKAHYSVGSLLCVNKKKKKEKKGLAEWWTRSGRQAEIK